MGEAVNTARERSMLLRLGLMVPSPQIVLRWPEAMD